MDISRAIGTPLFGGAGLKEAFDFMQGAITAGGGVRPLPRGAKMPCALLYNAINVPTC